MDKTLKSGTCIEFITSSGTYIGMYDSQDGKDFYVNDVMKINLTPMPTEDGKNFMMIPKLDLINFYSVSKDVFRFKVADIIYCEPVTGYKFVEIYQQQYKAYNDMKVQQGSNIEMADNIPSNIKNMSEFKNANI